MSYKDQTPLEVAIDLIADGFTVEKYQKIQDRRIERYNFWKERNFPLMANKEAELVEFGNAVITIMKLQSK